MKQTDIKGIQLFGLGVLFASLSFSTQLLDFTLVPRFLALGICMVVCFALLYKHTGIQSFSLDVIQLLYLLYTVLVCASIFWCTTISECLFESSKQILFYSVFLFTVYFMKKNAEFVYTTLTRISLVLFFLLCSFGIYQIIQLKSFDKEALYAVTGINGHKNLFSSFLFLNLFFLFRSVILQKGPLKYVYLFCILLSFLFLIFLKTKAVWFGLAFAIVSISILVAYRFDLKEKLTKNRVIVFVLSTLFLMNLFVVLFFKPLIHRSIDYTSQLPNESAPTAASLKLEEERLILWDKTLDIFSKHPLLGTGSGNWQIQFPDAGLSGLWRAEDLNYTFQRPHNDLLWILSESGLLGFNLFAAFVLFIISHLLRMIRLIKENYALSVELILCISFILGYAIISFFDFPKERIEHSVWIHILFGISYYHIINHKQIVVLKTIRLNKTLTLLSFIILCSTIYIGVLRFKGEFYTRKMYDYKNNDQKYELIKAAKKAFSFAYSIDPTSVPLHWYTGNANAALGMYDQAKSDFSEAFRFAPFNRNVLNDLASSYALNKNNELAKKYYEEAARISPRFDDPKLNLAALYIQENNFKMAEKWLELIYHDSERRTQYREYIKQNSK